VRAGRRFCRRCPPPASRRRRETPTRWSWGPDWWGWPWPAASPSGARESGFAVVDAQRIGSGASGATPGSSSTSPTSRRGWRPPTPALRARRALRHALPEGAGSSGTPSTATWDGAASCAPRGRGGAPHPVALARSLRRRRLPPPLARRGGHRRLYRTRFYRAAVHLPGMTVQPAALGAGLAGSLPARWRSSNSRRCAPFAASRPASGSRPGGASSSAGASSWRPTLYPRAGFPPPPSLPAVELRQLDDGAQPGRAGGSGRGAPVGVLPWIPRARPSGTPRSTHPESATPSTIARP